MPVRIYDIAKKLGMESKDVLAKAKDLGISAAKVPSSSLDKITAEYLKNKLGGNPAPATPPPPPAEPDQIIIVKAPEPPPVEEPAPAPEVVVPPAPVAVEPPPPAA